MRRTYASTAHKAGVKGSPVLGGGAKNGFSRLAIAVFSRVSAPITGLATAGAAGVTAEVANALLAVTVASVLAAGTFALGVAVVCTSSVTG